MYYILLQLKVLQINLEVQSITFHDRKKGEEKMQNEISNWKRMSFILLTLVLAFIIGYAIFTGGNLR